jgi:hypothetical protein
MKRCLAYLSGLVVACAMLACSVGYSMAAPAVDHYGGIHRSLDGVELALSPIVLTDRSTLAALSTDHPTLRSSAVAEPLHPIYQASYLTDAAIFTRHHMRC